MWCEEETDKGNDDGDKIFNICFIYERSYVNIHVSFAIYNFQIKEARRTYSCLCFQVQRP
jgi:hypothetical protein